MRRVLIDTSVYVDWFRSRRHEEIIAGRRGPPVLSAVVAMELITGERRGDRIESWAVRFHRAGRLLLPSWEAWRRAGRVLRALRGKGLYGPALTNDVLIAMTARVAGLIVFTGNRADFEHVAQIEPFDFEIVE